MHCPGVLDGFFLQRLCPAIVIVISGAGCQPEEEARSHSIREGGRFKQAEITDHVLVHQTKNMVKSEFLQECLKQLIPPFCNPTISSFLQYTVSQCTCETLALTTVWI